MAYDSTSFLSSSKPANCDVSPGAGPGLLGSKRFYKMKMDSSCRRKVVLTGRVLCEVPIIKSALCKDDFPVKCNVGAGGLRVALACREEYACLGVSAADLLRRRVVTSSFSSS